MKILKYIYIFIAISSLSLITSCDKGGEPEVEGTSTRKYAGDWFIRAKDAAGLEVSGYHLYLTYNTAANDNTMWIDDWATRTLAAPGTPAGYYLRTKLNLDLTSGSFSAPSQPNLNDAGSTVIITDGIITTNGGISKGGHVVDKITFKGVFSYAPNDVITFEGHKRTGFYEDEY